MELTQFLQSFQTKNGENASVYNKKRKLCLVLVLLFFVLSISFLNLIKIFTEKIDSVNLNKILEKVTNSSTFGLMLQSNGTL